MGEDRTPSTASFATSSKSLSVRSKLPPTPPIKSVVTSPRAYNVSSSSYRRSSRPDPPCPSLGKR